MNDVSDHGVSDERLPAFEISGKHVTFCFILAIASLEIRAAHPDTSVGTDECLVLDCGCTNAMLRLLPQLQLLRICHDTLSHPRQNFTVFRPVFFVLFSRHTVG